MYLDLIECMVHMSINYFIFKIPATTRCVCETQMPPIIANSKDDQGHKDKYLDTSGKILSREMIMCNMKAPIFIIQML